MSRMPPRSLYMLAKYTAERAEVAYPTKIATCCHCGAKAALKLDQSHHVLACASCGAPLRELKSIPKRVAPKPAISHQQPVRSSSKPKTKPVEQRKKPKSSKKSKKRKGWFAERFKDMAEDLFDVVEDIFD